MAYEEFMLGKRTRLSWVAETSYGSGGVMATNGEVIGLNATLVPDLDQNWIEVLSAGADSRAVEDRIAGPLTLNFTLHFTPVNWKWLKYLMTVADGGVAGAYTHTFTIANSIQSFKLEWAQRHTTAHVLTFTGVVMLGATLTFAKATGAGEGMITVSARCNATAVSAGSSVTTLDAGNITADPFQWRHAKVTLDGTEITELNNGEIVIDNGIDLADSRYCNSTLARAQGEPIPKVYRINGRFNANVKDSSFFTDWNAATKLVGTTKLELIRGASDNIVFTFASFRYATANDPTNLEGVSNVDLVWTDDSPTSVIATDSEATY